MDGGEGNDRESGEREVSKRMGGAGELSTRGATLWVDAEWFL